MTYYVTITVVEWLGLNVQQIWHYYPLLSHNLCRGMINMDKQKIGMSHCFFCFYRTYYIPSGSAQCIARSPKVRRWRSCRHTQCQEWVCGDGTRIFSQKLFLVATKEAIRFLYPEYLVDSLPILRYSTSVWASSALSRLTNSMAIVLA